jgi:GMP synthase (glutamine-hydrolysing)
MSRTHEWVVILDFGSQYTQLIARRVREASVYCEIHPFSASFEALAARLPKAVILSGGPSSVYDEGAPALDPRWLQLGVPILGVCYGLQLIAHALGGKVEPASHREYGAADMRVLNREGVLQRLEPHESTRVWMSHGDRLVKLPSGFKAIGESDACPFAAIANEDARIWGVQFHPEVEHTRRGRDVLAAFLFDIAKVAPTWTPGSFVSEAISAISARVPPDAHVICGLSGGVDSTVAAVLCHRALGARLTCIFVDNGLLRLGEFDQVCHSLGGEMGLPLVAVDARERFMSALSGQSDPETKRKIIGRVFIEVFEAEAKKIKGTQFLVQGTLYPDVIESVSHKGPSVVIKSHHNVGGLPERMNLKLIEPLRELFKDEVRAAGKALDIPAALLGRHPFPGPGLGIRCLGDLSETRLDALRKADHIFIDELRAAGLYDQVWQAFAALLPVRSVGVMGDGRTYEETVALRAVTSIDGMTADWAQLPHEFLARVSGRIINEVRGVNRVVYDISSKPPATIEWE